MRSMTGYGKGVAERKERKVTIELKTVNHRFLDILFKLPRGFQQEEEALRRVLNRYLTRGHVDVFLTYEDLREEKDEIKIDTKLAALYYNAAKELEKSGIVNDVSASTVLRLPDVVSVTPKDDDEELRSALVAEAAERAAINLVAMREREGAALAADLKGKISTIENLLSEVLTRAPQVAAEYREKLAARVQDALSATEIDESKLLNEVAFFVDKSNIDEETVRLQGHLSHFLEILQQGGAVGKSLDFLVQEMNREVNTTGSKAQDLKLTERVLLMKNEVEKIREQIQNLE